MRVWLGIAVASVVLSAGLIAAPSGAAVQSVPSAEFTLGFDREIDPAQVTVFAIVRAPSGQGFWAPAPNLRKISSTDYAFVPNMRGTPANLVRLMVYCRGYQVVYFDARAVSALIEPKVRIALTSLATVPLKGQIALTSSEGSGPFRIDVGLDALSAAFATILSGPGGGSVGSRPPIIVASGPVAPDGSFTVEVPDFARDPWFSKAGVMLSGFVLTTARARFDLNWVDRPAGNGRGEGLAIHDSYPNVIHLDVRRR